jgi:WD40 repeat protein
MVWPRANYVFTCDWDGILKQFSLSDFSLYRTFNKVIKKGARKMVATRNSRHLFIGDLDGFIKHYTLEDDGDLKHRNFFRDHDSAIRAMA